MVQGVTAEVRCGHKNHAGAASDANAATEGRCGEQGTDRRVDEEEGAGGGVGVREQATCGELPKDEARGAKQTGEGVGGNGEGQEPGTNNTRNSRR